MQPLALGAVSTRPWVPQGNGAEKEKQTCISTQSKSSASSGKIPSVAKSGQRRELHRLSVATQRSWKDTQDEWHSKTEWHRVIAWNGLGERIAASLRKGDHVLVEGTLVSSSFEREVRKGKKNATVKQVSWSIRADAVRKLNRTDKEPEAIASGSSQAANPQLQEHAESAPF